MQSQPIGHFPAQCESSPAPIYGENRNRDGSASHRLPKRRLGFISKRLGQVPAAQHWAVPVYQRLFQGVGKRRYFSVIAFLVGLIAHAQMLSNPSRHGQRVTTSESLTPGEIPKYGVPLNYKEVVAMCLALCAASSTANGPIDDVANCVKEMRAINLYHCVQRFIGTKNPAQMQRFFEPNSVSYHKDEGLALSKKYRNYFRGTCLPSAQTLAIMTKVTDQDWTFEQHKVLWTVLDLTVSPQPMEIFLRYLADMAAQQLALQLNDCLTSGRVSKVSLLCFKLLMLPGMPSLEALILVLRLAHDSGMSKAASIVANYLALKLMFMGSELQQRGIGSVLFRLAVHHLFPLAGEWKIDITPLGLARRSLLLNVLSFCGSGITANTRIGQTKREEIMFLWQSQCFGRMFTEALSLRVLKGGHRHETVSVQDAWRQQAATQFVEFVDHTQCQPPRVWDRSYLNPDVDFRLLAKHHWVDVRPHLKQLGQS